MILHRRVYVCERHAQLPEKTRDRLSEMMSRVVGEEIEAACILERKKCSEITREATKLARFIIENRGCVCNVAGHRCGTNQMLADVAKIEEQLS